MITLKPWPSQQVQPLNDLYLDVDQSNCLVTLQVPFPMPQTQSYLDAIHHGYVEDKPFLCFAIEQDDTIVGKIELTKYPNEDAEVDLVIKKSYSQQGIGTQAMLQLQQYVQQHHWCKAIHAYVDANNKAMCALLTKTNFQPVRRFKADVMVPIDGKYQLKEVPGIAYIYQVKTFI